MIHFRRGPVLTAIAIAALAATATAHAQGVEGTRSISVSLGTGIGLAICRSIIEYHEGRLFFEPREGGGSVFGFTLPRAEGRV